MTSLAYYYYWDDEFRTKAGKTLQECFDQFGTGTQMLPRTPVRMEVIFLDARRSFGYAWVLRCYSVRTGLNVPDALYEENRVYGSHPLNPS